MRKKELIKTRLYFALSVLLLTAVCIVVYTSMRSGGVANRQFSDQVQEQTKDPAKDTSNLQPVNSATRPRTTPQDQTDTKVDSEQEHTAQTEKTYRIGVCDGCLQVYIAQTGQLYMETAIAYDLLPKEVQEQIDAGKTFESEQTLLEFLENYSS